MNKTFYILSIDGGGILGLYSADILAKIQNEFCFEKPLSEKFHLISGTSTGGIIALALSTGCKAEEIVDFYKNQGEKIFPKKNKWKKGVFSHKYSNENLKQVLQEFFTDKKIKDCKTKVCIPSIDVANCQPVIFKTNNNGQQTRDENYSLVDIALATSAAPTYFPLHKFENYRGLVDGGLWQNNPALFAVIEALNCFVGNKKDFDNICVLSIGNPHSALPNTLNVRTENSSFLKWKDNLVSIPMKISSIGTHQILNFLHQNNSLSIKKYVRIQSNNLPVEYNRLSLDSADSNSYKMLLDISSLDFNLNKKNLYNFFKEE